MNISKSDLTALCLYVYVLVRSWFSYVYLSFCTCLNGNNRFIPPSSEYHHKIIFLGDGFAQGFGPMPILGQKNLFNNALARSISNDDKIRHRWSVLNIGDWKTNVEVWKTRVTDMLRHEKYKDAALFVICLGNENVLMRMDPDVVVKELESIVDVIRKKGKRVCLATLAICGDEHVQELIRKCNRLITEYAERTKYDDIPVVIGPSLHSPILRKPEMKTFDGIHFNARGYKIVAKDAFEMLKPMMIQEEWVVWKAKLNTITYSKDLYD